jgi:hypothetical protein
MDPNVSLEIRDVVGDTGLRWHGAPVLQGKLGGERVADVDNLLMKLGSGGRVRAADLVYELRRLIRGRPAGMT